MRLGWIKPRSARRVRDPDTGAANCAGGLGGSNGACLTISPCLGGCLTTRGWHLSN
jgi:hypothetical protein